MEKFYVKDYLDYINEHVENWSYLKFPYTKADIPMALPVGPSGVVMQLKIHTPLADAELKIFKAINNSKPVENTLYYHYTRLIETLYATEHTRELLEDPDILSTDILNTCRDMQKRGVGVIEAPRGTLIHDYHITPTSQIRKVNLIVSTGHNNYAMSKAVDSVAKL